MEKDYGDKTYAFIDASNLWEAQKKKGKLFDLEKLKKFIKDTYGATTLKIYYYTAYPAEGTRDYSLDGKHKFFTYLTKALGFEVIKKELKRITVHTKHGDVIEEKGNMDVEMTIDVMRHLDKYDTALFFTGDSDFLALATYLRNAGKKVFTYSSKNNISEELRTGTDGYIDILDIEADIWRGELRHRNQK